MPLLHVKPSDKAITAYYAAKQRYTRQGVSNEGAVRNAFQYLLEDTGRRRNWTLLTEQGSLVHGGRVIPDGTLRDESTLARGYWEAKDSADDLDAEIQKKIARGYPTTNIIFEDTRQAVLYQDRAELLRADLSKPDALAELLNAFFQHSEPDIEEFEKAVDEFKERVPELARGLLEKIHEAHRNNKKFAAAFAAFYELCKSALNPNLSIAAVNEMLVQHLLTERLIRTIFDNPDFAHQNVIAAEVEKVITALLSRSLRSQFLKSLDRFYVAIENAARGLPDFAEKQHFLNTIYERFFQGYSVRVADTHGIVYTPQAIVDFMCASVEHVLKEEFGAHLGAPEVQILDPCTGTGNFIVHLLNRIARRDLRRMYEHQLFANEVMLLPYYIAALNIEHAYFERAGEYEPFPGLCFVDTLDLAEDKADPKFSFMTAENTERVKRQKKAPITVVIGNPPYNVGQLNENDNNKNRKYPVVDGRVKDTYVRDSKATLKAQLYDPYVKFFRWATDRLGKREGIVCFVSNNSFVEQLAFDGMRQHLLSDFTRIYHVDLHGNVRKNPKLSGTTHNVFGIQVGVGVTVAVRGKAHAGRKVFYTRVEEDWRKERKLAWLAEQGHVGRVAWRQLEPDDRHTWLVPEHGEAFAGFTPLGSKEAKALDEASAACVFKTFSGGVKTNRDQVVYDFEKTALLERMQAFIEAYNGEVDRFKRQSGRVTDIDAFVDYSGLKWDGTLKGHLQDGKYATFDEAHVRGSLYRPFTSRWLYFDRLLLNSVYLQRRIFPTRATEQENRVICVPGPGDRKGFGCFASDFIVSLDFAFEKAQCFPFYIYDEDGTHRRENLTDWALETFRKHYGDKKISKWDIFHYVYGLLHHPGYRTKYAANLKRELPRIPLAPDFRAFAQAGAELARLHLDYEKLEPYDLQWIEATDRPFSYRVEDKMRLTKDKTELTVNPSLALAGIPPETYQYRLGNRSALEWVVDQYQVKEDARSGIRSDPNRDDDPEYIVRLVGQVVRVGLATTQIVKALPAEFGG